MEVSACRVVTSGEYPLVRHVVPADVRLAVIQHFPSLLFGNPTLVRAHSTVGGLTAVAVETKNLICGRKSLLSR